MERRTSLRTSTRSSHLDLPADRAWPAVTAAGGRGRWYTEAPPFVVRGAIDRLLGGAGRRWPVPTADRLADGDRAGFWEVREADDRTRVLRLEAAVRAPGTVVLTTTVAPAIHGCTLTQAVSFAPSGLLGTAYLLADLPARELVVELAHRTAVEEVLSRATRPRR
jgi:Protein of unknown function (DUF2867)/Polyketide cyclase / dehydrase and lipid transport